MFFGRLTNTSKKESSGQTLHRAVVVQMYETKELRRKFYGLQVGSKMGCDKNGDPIVSSDLAYVRDMAYRYNRSINNVE